MDEKWFPDGAVRGRLGGMRREVLRGRPGWMRVVFASVLALLVAATAVVPHTHGLGGGVVRLAGTATADPSVGASTATGARQERPCTACARQQDQGIARAVRDVVAPYSQPVLLAAAPLVRVTTGQGPNVWLRGPPPVMSVG
jgi:hypothetical protein